MITIQFYRYVPTTKVVKLKKDHIYHNVFSVSKDHEVTQIDSQCTLEKARLVATRWLKDHYGYVTIHLDNQGENDSGFGLKITNRKKFIKDMHSMSFEVAIKKAA